jgi:glutamine---fructose-6-phosphate transaminase (isomerizing)
MCGIFGLIDLNNKIDKKKNILLSLAKFSSRRGKDSTGIWLSKNNLEHSCVLSVNYKMFIKADKFKKNILPFITESNIILGFCRLATNGETYDFQNNQPLIKDGLVLAHNGIIVNSDNLAKMFGVKKYESDSRVLMEIILKLKKNKGFSVVEAIKYLSKYLIGTLNLVLIDNSDTKDVKVIFISNNGSLYLGDLGYGVIFASEEFFLRKLNVAEIKIKKIVSGKIFEYKVNKSEMVEDELSIPIISKRRRIKENIKTGLEGHRINFDEISKIKRCTKCILPKTTPFIDFDENGVCNYCREHRKIKHKGLFSLRKLVKKYRSNNSNPDCIIAFSGGRDSSYGLHFLVKVLKLHPVAVTFDWGMLSDVGRRNQSRMLSKLGVEHIVVAANIRKAREDIGKNLKAWLKRPELGMLPLLMQGDKTTEYYVDKIKIELGIKLVFFCRGNELEKEEFKSGYCGVKNADPGGVIHNYHWLDKLRLLDYYIKQFLLNPAYLNRSLWSSFLGYLVTFVIPHDYIYLWHYIPWNEDKIIRILKKEYGWEGDDETDSTWRVDDGSPAFYNYVYCHIQGFTENDSFRSRQIREKMITRDEALKLVMKENQPRYNMLSWYFNKVGVDGNNVLTVVDKTSKMF